MAFSHYCFFRSRELCKSSKDLKENGRASVSVLVKRYPQQMPLQQYTTTKHKKVLAEPNGLHHVDLPFASRVETSKGGGKIMGSNGDKQEFYVLLDQDAKEELVTVFSYDAIGTEVFSKQLTSKPISLHPLRSVYYNGHSVKIVMQREHGPCPIFAVANALALEQRITIRGDYGEDNIEEETLNDILSVYFRELTAKTLGSSKLSYKAPLSCEESRNFSDKIAQEPASEMSVNFTSRTLSDFLKDRASFEEMLKKLLSESSSSDSIDHLLRRLYKGLDVDVVFSDSTSFRMDQNVIFFALFGLKVFHGWVIGPMLSTNFSPLTSSSYNELTELLAGAVPSKFKWKEENAKEEKSSRAMDIETMQTLAQQFYTETKGHQMTSDGFSNLLRVIPENEFTVLFFQNHFHTITRREDRLLTLLTHESYADRPTCVFARISPGSFSLDEFFDGNGYSLDSFISFVNAAADQEYTNEEILRAKEKLEEQRSSGCVYPDEVLVFLKSNARSASKEFSEEKKAMAMQTVVSYTVDPDCRKANGRKTKIIQGTVKKADEGAIDLASIQKLVDVIGVSNDEAEKLLLVSNGNVEEAAGFYFESH